MPFLKEQIRVWKDRKDDLEEGLIELEKDLETGAVEYAEAVR